VRFDSVAGWLDWQQVAHPTVIDLGLERAGAVYRRMGLARPATVLTIGGTNGKGSVAATLDALLAELPEDRALELLHRYGERFTAAAAMAKLTATETAQSVIDRALQMFGGRGVTHGEVVEGLYREIRALRIYEGASEVQKLVIGRELLK